MFFSHLTSKVLVEVLPRRSIEEGVEEVFVISEELDSWKTPIQRFLKHGILPESKKEARKVRINASKYTILQQTLYRRGYSTPWLKCLAGEEIIKAIQELHSGMCGSHAGSRAITHKLLRTGYFWPTMTKDVVSFIKKCDKCQIHSDVPALPQTRLTSIASPWPFFQWGIDIVGPFPVAPGRVKFLVVAIDYFTKWVEAEPLASITGNHMVKFVWKQIVCRFGVPHTIISDNGQQFASNPFRAWCSKMSITQRFTSVAHPQANGQTEVTNKTLVKGIKKRLDQAKGGWADELQNVLWSYRTTVRTPTQETPFSLVYGMEAVIPVEMCLPTLRIIDFNRETNEKGIRSHLDTVEERREMAALKQAAYKSMTEKYYDKRVRETACKIGDLVLRKSEASRPKEQGKLDLKWEGPYRVVGIGRNGSYGLETLEGKRIPRTWNINNLKKWHF